MKIIRIGFLALCLMMTLSSVAYANISYPDLSDVTGVSVSLVNQDPYPAIAGDIVDIYLGIENIGGESAGNLVVELEPEYPFTLVTGEPAVQNIGTIKSYQKDNYMKIITYTIKVDSDASAGSYDITVKYYEPGDSLVTEKSIRIDVKNKEMAEIIHIDKTNLVPGKQNSLKFTINNVGNAPLKDMTFSWVNEDKIILPVGSDNTKYIKSVDIGESVELDYQVIADYNADPGLYELKLFLFYDDPITYEEKEISTIAGINVGGVTDFYVALSDSSGSETTFSVANIGSNPAYSVSVIVPRQNGWQVSGPNSVIIGNLNKGDYTVASFNIISTQQMTDLQDQDIRTVDVQDITRQESNGLIIQIAYTDTIGERKVIEKEVAIIGPKDIGSEMPSGITGSFETYKWYILGFIILITGFVLYNKYRKRKLIDPQFKIKDLYRKFNENRGR
ncbi:MAG TPA: hypothetical protein HA304_05515 [Methanosarcinales archaeon]|nr:hypothetical protein [Methanosarcinales archaeon]